MLSRSAQQESCRRDVLSGDWCSPRHGYFKPIPKLKKMLMTKDKCQSLFRVEHARSRVYSATRLEALGPG